VIAKIVVYVSMIRLVDEPLYSTCNAGENMEERRRRRKM